MRRPLALVVGAFMMVGLGGAWVCAAPPSDGSYYVYSVYYRTKDFPDEWLPAVADAGTYLKSLADAKDIASDIKKREGILGVKIEADKLGSPLRDKALRAARGQLTFDAEISTADKTSSLRPQVPSDESGLTIGPGYDLKRRNAEEVVADLTAAGLSGRQAEKYAQAIGLSGDDARKFINDHADKKLGEAAALLGLKGAEARQYVEANRLDGITRDEQKKLFEIVYPRYEADVKRISEKQGAIKDYGRIDWPALDPAIYETLVDLRYRGDYTPETRKLVQKAAVQNDLNGFTEAMSDRDAWSNLSQTVFDEHRFNQRVRYLKEALKDKAAKDQLREVNRSLQSPAGKNPNPLP